MGKAEIQIFPNGFNRFPTVGYPPPRYHTTWASYPDLGHAAGAASGIKGSLEGQKSPGRAAGAEIRGVGEAHRVANFRDSSVGREQRVPGFQQPALTNVQRG